MNWRQWLGLTSRPVDQPTDVDVPYVLSTPEELEQEEAQKRLLREQLDLASETLRHLEIQWRLRNQRVKHERS